MTASAKTKIFLLGLILIASIAIGITKGSVNIPMAQLFSLENRSILTLRLLRIVVAILAGSGLATSGIALQAVLRNPLAEPYLLGTSSGAALGAVVALLVGLSSIHLPLAAFIGSILTVAFVYSLAKQNHKITTQSLILCGVVVSIAISGIVVFAVYFFENKTLHNLMWWLWGSLQFYDIKLLGIVSAFIITGIICIFTLAQDLNALSLGEEEATHLGINTEKIKTFLFITTSLITASLVCICGIIGFVGLIIPHAMRFFIGQNHKILIPAACLAASSFMILCDLISRTLLPPLEIPIGVMTACIGTPLFIILLKTKEKIR